MAKTFELSKSALRAQATRLSASAHNVANLNTAGFRPQRVRLEALAQGMGVMARVEPAASDPPVSVPDLPNDRALLGYSQVDLVVETVTRLTAQRAYEANSMVIRLDSARWKNLLHTA